MQKLETELGKIYCQYNKENDDFLKIRLVDIIQNDSDERDVKYVFKYMDEDYNFTSEKIVDTDEYNDIRRNWILLKSDGIISLTNIVAVENEVRQIKDVITLFFPNNKATGYPISSQAFVLARQGIDNIFDEDRYAERKRNDLNNRLNKIYEETQKQINVINNFTPKSIISSRLCHIYKIDSGKNISEILDNEETSAILKDLYDHQLTYLQNTDGKFDPSTAGDNLNGYNKTLQGFLENSGFLTDVFEAIGITTVDFELKFNVPLDLDDKIFISMLYGGIRINKAVPLKFDYDINLKAIKMKYLLIRDINGKLWILPYTTYDDSVDILSIYNMTDERVEKFQERLQHRLK